MLWIAAAALCAACAAGCGGARTPSARAPSAPAARRCVAGAERSVGSLRTAVAAIVERPTTAFRVPGHGRIARFGRMNVNHVPTVFGVLSERVSSDCSAEWLHVALPMRPNGITGWIRARDVRRAVVHTRIAVDLSQRRLRLYRNGRLLLRSVVAIGSRATPTPLGRYYVNQRLIPSDPTGPYGPGAVGISAFSPVLTGWALGGPVAIHGTNEPWSIGRAVSNGCIRLPNSVLRRVFAEALAGTPVVITA